MTSDLEAEFKQVQSMTEGREVSFADQTFNAENQSFSLSGLLDFKSLPSMDSSEPNSIVSESVHQQTEPNSILHVPTGLDSTYLKSTSTAGHTPFPKEHFIQNVNNSVNKVLKSPQLFNASCSSLSADHVSDVTNVLNSGTLPIASPGYKNKQCLQSNQTHVNEDIFRPVPVMQGIDKCLTNQPLNGTFTLEEDSNDDQNSTFTLMETNDKDPQVLINTPVISDKFVGHNRENVQHDRSNTTCLQNAETHNRPLGNMITENVHSSSNQVTLPDCVNKLNNINSAQISVSYLSENRTACEILTTNSCDSMTSQKMHSETQLPGQSNIRELQTQYGDALQAKKDLNSMPKYGPEVERNMHLPNSCVSSHMSESSVILPHAFTQQTLDTLIQGSSQTITKEKSDLVEKVLIIQGSSQTITKEKSDLVEKGLVDKSHAVRSITFGGIPCTPESVRKVRSYSEAVQSPPVTRTPLREMNSNTPLSDQTHGKPMMNNKLKMSRENLFGDDSGKVKETSKKLNELGLPSLMERWHTDPRKNKSQDTQPSYMQPTKAVRYRTKPRHINNENLEPSRVPLNQTVRNRNFKRSQSVSNVSKRGWQI